MDVWVGPTKTQLSPTDHQLVFWDEAKKQFQNSERDRAIQTYTSAPEGSYVVLSNPSDARDDEAHPREAVKSAMVRLKTGRKVNIQGPAHFPLWPGQSANVIPGHQLRSNQYLLVRVYNDEEAKANWEKAVMKPQTQIPPKAGDGQEAAQTEEPKPPTSAVPPNLVMGQLIVIKGTDVSFYIPPTGIEVLPEDSSYVREAVTLERLEYCILLDENGNKRYVRGPDVVFPKPTEQFVENNGNRKSRAIELNELSGIYVKVIADYKEGDREFRVGEELFITGKDQAIYFPRAEHAIIEYDAQKIHYATAVPAGEGRYVLDRIEGKVETVGGPTMLLPDPRRQVIINRTLDTRTVELWYPGNQEALKANQQLAELSKSSPEEYLTERTTRLYASERGAKGLAQDFGGDTMQRKTSYTPPRTLTLDTKYKGAVAVSPWTGFAILVVNKTGGRRVVEGPRTVLLDYDETLMPMELSTGKPKTTDNLKPTVYLRVLNNRVSDIVDAETSDLVRVSVKVSYRVNFEGDDKEKWFAVDNYVKFLCDHLRSKIRNAVKHHGIEDFNANAIDIIRDTVLGKAIGEGSSRPGQLFKENQMRVYDVEVLGVTIGDTQISQLLIGAQNEALRSTLEIAKKERELDLTRRGEKVTQDIAEVKSATKLRNLDLQQHEATKQLEVNLAQIEAEARAEIERRNNEIALQEKLDSLSASELARDKEAADQDLAIKKQEMLQQIERLQAETAEIVKRTEAMDDKLVAAMQAFADQALMERLASTMAPLAIIGGESVADAFSRLVKGTPLEKAFDAVVNRGAKSLVPAQPQSHDNR